MIPIPSKLLPGHYSVYAFAPEALTDWATPDASMLTAAIAAGLGWDISCAIDADNYSLGVTGFATDDSKSICDIGNVENATFTEYEVSLDGFRSDPSDPTAVYDTFYELFSGVDREFYIVERVGPLQGTAFAAGQRVSAYGAKTDYGVDVVGDNEMIRWGARFKPTGNLNTLIDLVA